MEVAKANEIKRGITDAVSKALKAVQKENINTEDRAVYRSVFVCLCLTSHQQLRSYGDIQVSEQITINSFLAIGNFCLKLITFANSLDPPRSGPTV